MDQEEINNQNRWMALHTKVFEEKIKNCFLYFRENGIEPILIKGWAAAQNYPDKISRIYTDIDICVAPEKYSKSLKLLNEEKGRTLNVDLHCGMRHLDTVEWEDLFENTRIVTIDDLPIRILRPEDHLRVLCVHWLTDGGAFKDKLWDIYYAVQNRQKNFDWNRCLDSAGEIRRQWIIKTVGLTSKYLNLDISDLPFACEAKNIPEWLIRTVEKEWADEIRLKPLHLMLGRKNEFLQQLRKRIPPNAIQATIELGGKFDHKPRIFYQMGSVFIRIKPSLGRFYRTFKVAIGYNPKNV